MSFLPLRADPVAHKFRLWGDLHPKLTQGEKMILYWGWTNGFFQGRGPQGLKFANCLETIATDQAIAMIDKQYKDHPEKWSDFLGEQIIEALTVAGGPCEGKWSWDVQNAK
jgi:hypothetical protein